MTKEEILQYLNEEVQRLLALIKYLEGQGSGNPEYHRIAELEQQLEETQQQLNQVQRS